MLLCTLSLRLAGDDLNGLSILGVRLVCRSKCDAQCEEVVHHSEYIVQSQRAVVLLLEVRNIEDTRENDRE